MTFGTFKKGLFFIILFFYGFSALAQQFDSLLHQLDTKFPQEKIYIQYDRPYYNPGETIWFKAYLMSGNLPSLISKTMYAELLDDNGSILQKKIMPVVESGAASFFELQDSLVAKLLYVRAYTAWMLNFDSTLIYVKPIGIINSSVKKITPLPVSYNVDFFPEGGDLINGIESLVAFKATDPSGNPVNVSGSLMNTKGTKISTFSSVHNGMGTFSLKPIAGESYKAIWKDKKGVLHEKMLPPQKNRGVSLSITKINNLVTYTLKRSENTEPVRASYTVVAQMQQQLIYSAKINLSARNDVTAAFPTDSLGTGIVQLTVFNADNIPEAERIFFINHNNFYFNTDLHAAELNLNRRKHNTLQVDVGGSVVSNLSIAVTDESLSAYPANRENIYSNILLTSDLKGYVYNPAYYFSSEEDSVARQLDLVMLTNGWRRFKWEKLLAGEFPVIRHQPENFISLSGYIYGPAPNLLKGKEITGILKTRVADDFYTMPVDKDGKFELNGISFFDTARLYYQINMDKERKLTSMSSFSFKVNFSNAGILPLSYLNSLPVSALPDTGTSVKNQRIVNLMRDDFNEGKKVKSLQTIVLKSKVKTREQLLDEKYTSGFFTSSDAEIFNVEDDPLARSSQTVLNYLQARVSGLQITMSTPPKVSWRMSKTIFFLNETSTEIDQVQNIPMNDVALIKVFRPPFFSATNGGAGGAIAVYLKKGGGRDDFKGLDFVRLNGYSSIKEFYSPDYEKLSENAPVNDYRTTLYWNPFLILDKDRRRIKIPFYNSDNCKKIRVIIEGINKEGLLTREEKIFE